ncbi:ABC transporter substrate-binding protein [Jatrophihabitans sp. DSM 45814]
MRRNRFMVLMIATAAVASVTTACGSSSNSPNGGAATASSAGATAGTIKVGVVNDNTGAAASAFTTTETGIKAYVNWVNAAGGVNGQKIEYVMADATSTPAGALTAAKNLVQNDKVFAVIAMSSTFFGAEPYLLKEGVPGVGRFDGPEFADPKNTNLFAADGVVDYNSVYATGGEYFKARGVTSCAALGYSDSPSASKSATTTLASCKAAGLKSGYVDQVPFGSTDTAPIALGMKSAGVDGAWLAVVPNTGFALAASLRQVGVNLKSLLFGSGYGGDLLASPAAVTAAQGFEFSSNGQAAEMNTPATQQMGKNLAAVGYTGVPTYAIQSAYHAMSAFVAGLKAAGPNPSRASYITALRGVKDFDSDGLMAPLKIDFSSYSPAETCLWTAQLEGKKFIPIPTVCGQKIAGATS